LAFLYALLVLYRTLAYGEPVAGYPSLMVVVLFLGGAQLAAVGVLGEYVGRIFVETKQRPLYHVQDYLPAGAATAGPADSLDRTEGPTA
jgi:polyisoprenyl-phosphate glycosyltransferase